MKFKCLMFRLPQASVVVPSEFGGQRLRNPYITQLIKSNRSHFSGTRFKTDVKKAPPLVQRSFLVTVRPTFAALTHKILQLFRHRVFIVGFVVARAISTADRLLRSGDWKNRCTVESSSPCCHQSSHSPAIYLHEHRHMGRTKGH